MNHAAGGKKDDESGDQKKHIHTDGPMLQYTCRSGMSGQPARGIKADDRRLQVGGQHQQGGYTTQGVKEMIASLRCLDRGCHGSALNPTTHQ